MENETNKTINENNTKTSTEGTNNSQVIDNNPNLGSTQTKQDTNIYGAKFLAEIDTLDTGTNPSEKCLVQHIWKPGDAYDECKILYDAVCGAEEFIPLGNKAEYILANDTVVNKLIPTEFIATQADLLNPSDHTYVDEVALPDILWGSTKTPSYKPTLFEFLLKHYYVSGLNIKQIYSMIVNDGDKMLFKYKFMDFMLWLKRIYDYLCTKTATSDIKNVATNYFVDSTTGAVDAFKNFQLFIENLSKVNNKYMLGEAQVSFDPTTHEEVYNGFQVFNKCYTKANLQDLIFITDKETLASIKKWLTMLPQNVNKLIDVSQFYTIPLSYLNVKKPNGVPNDLPSIIETNDFFNKNNVYQKGTILVLQKGYLKSVFNYKHNGATSYVKNHSYQLVNTTNYNLKPLKFMICGVYQNEHIQDNFAVPITEIGE